MNGKTFFFCNFLLCFFLCLMIERIDFNGLEIEKENKMGIENEMYFIFLTYNLMLFLIF